ncbi:alpha-L-rhamnosidase [Actinomadura roseirufa]|uniref:alpha-L-rhamnosidase n=1 Tax=Actinomadura roseirufa TaxID=2094049 RepID=UPI0010416B24|nr:alpha-L-rhamnosidase [Actinomadura roseirufa]
MTDTGELLAARLRCQHLDDPLGLDVPAPVFGWEPDGPGGQRQTAYQVLVASAPELLTPEAADRWDSGRGEGDEVNGIAYAGRPLRSRERCWWTVRLWDRAGRPGPLTPPATFEMGLMEIADWGTAAWIAGDAGVSSPLLRTAFHVPGRVTRARAHVSALGYYELRLNGERVGDRVLDPATSTYDHDPDLRDGEGEPARIPNPRVLSTTYDVTDLVTAGDNAAGLILGHGWYSAEPDVVSGPFPRTPWGDRPAALLRIEIETDSGRPVTIVSDGAWRAAAGPITYNDYVHGERYDARREIPGWDRAGHAAGEWRPVAVVDPPAGRVRTGLLEPARVIETLRPVATTTITSTATSTTTATATAAEGGLIVDFGQHVSGWTAIRVAGPAGAQVRLRHAGEVDADGRLDDRATMHSWLAARQTDVYTLRGGGEEDWEPSFTLHGFRYVEVASSSPEVEVREVRARVVHSDLAPAGQFSCSDDLLNRIHRNVLWTFRASFQGFPQDAADRAERVGWVGDPGWSVEDYLYTFEARAFWLKWLDDLADTQLADGRFPTVCPLQWRGRVDMRATLDEADFEDAEKAREELPDDWSSVIYWPYAPLPDFAMTSYPSIAWNLYQFYGDRSILRRHYPGMRRGLEFLRTRAKDLVITGGLGDHMEPQPDGTSSVTPKRTPIELTSTAWFHAVTTMVARAAGAVGEDDDARYYGELAEEIRAVFNDRFLDTATGRYATGSQTAQALPLWFGLVPGEHRDRVGRALIERIEADGGHLSTGTMGTAALQNVLAGIGAADVMYGIATKTTYPSWGEQVELGATTIWETWGGDPTFSRNMKLMAMIEKFLFNDVAGLAPADPGWRRIRVRPSLTHRLTHAGAALRTPRGEAAVDWRTGEDDLRLVVRVPSTSEAEIWLPAEDAVELTKDGRPLWRSGDAPGVPGPPGLDVRGISRDGEWLVVAVDGGTHRFALVTGRD